MNLTDDCKIKIGNMVNEIAQLKNEKMFAKSTEESEKIDLKITNIKWQKKQLLDGIDPKLLVETRSYLDWISETIDAKTYSIEEFKKEGFNINYDYIHFLESGLIWRVNKSKTFTILAQHMDNGRNLFLDNQQKFILISTNDKQLFNIPTIARPLDTYEEEIEKLCQVIISFMKDVYNINDIKRNDLILLNCKKYPIILIPKHYVDNTTEKHKIICNLQNYIGQNYKDDLASLLDSRIKGCMPYYDIPQVERLGIITEKTVDSKTYEYFRKDPNHAFFSNVSNSQLIPNNIILNTNVDNRITIDKSVHINESQNVNIQQDTSNSSVAVNTNNTNVYSKIHTIHNMNEYISFITDTPPIWHIKNKVVDVKKLYAIYQENIGGTSQIAQFGKFLSSLSSHYKKLTTKKRDGNIIPTRYMILK